MKNLITDRDLLSGAVTGRIVLDGSVLLTPAARDRAARLGLEVVEPGAPAASAATSCGRCGSSACRGGCAGCPNASAATCAGCGNASCSCAGAGSASRAPGAHAPTLGSLPDGLYLVRVQSGRPVSVLPASGPGLLRRASGA
jgi:hypothetical protein